MTDPEPWITVAELPPGLDGEVLSLQLTARGVVHQIEGSGERRLLRVARREDIPTVLLVLREYGRRAATAPPGLAAQARAVPVVVAVLLLGLAGALLVSFAPYLVPSLTFQDFTLSGGGELRLEPPGAAFARGEYWRLLTPAFLHFGIFHIVFNALWIWEFGRRIEALVGPGNFLVIFLATAIGANVGQYLWQPDSLFGGLSGVVYGLLGYIWVRHRLAPHSLLRLTPGIAPLMLAWLLLCLVGVVDWFIQGGVANGAHVTGLLIGAAFGALAGVSARGRA
jgi:GlpG protein